MRFYTLLREGKITFPNIKKEEIQDKSKADGLSKFILIIQTLWFVIKCIGRHAQGLALTQLEVATLAVISSTFMLCIIWWHKPLDVRHPIYLNIVMVSSQRVIVEEQDLLKTTGGVPRTLAAERRISTYFAADKAHPNMLKTILIKQNSISSLGGAVLGLVHCISWGSQFPTTVERNLWRISALAVAVSAILAILRIL
ncbi:hypothetical protein BDQ17DRAFT_1328541 [Cyathus striatus]|nr:hypothetical protein BDQ17DRAFT_1328541 [Cyathus striatus]